MMIDRVEALIIRIPFKPGSQADDAAWGDKRERTADTLLIKVMTDDGLVGWGECFGFGMVSAIKQAIDRVIAPLCIGRDAAQIAPLMLDLQRKTHIFGRGGLVKFGLSGLDIALWDLAGKAAGMPVHRLLGGGCAQTLPAYASLIRFSEPERLRHSVRCAIDAGFSSVKLHEVDFAAVRAARDEAGPDIAIMLDVNCPCSLGEAQALLPVLREFGLSWLEEPLWPPENFNGLADLRRVASIPIAAGENASTLVEFDRLMAVRAVDVVQPSPAKMGGLTELVKVAAIAEARSVELMVHSFYDGPGMLAAIHATAALGSARSTVEWRCFDLEAQLYDADALLAGGRVSVPPGPGLGLEPNPDVVSRYTINAP